MADGLGPANAPRTDNVAEKMFDPVVAFATAPFERLAIVDLSPLGRQPMESADGRLVLTGRKRLFVNVGGNKVDPTEVEAVLLALDGVVDAAVVGVPDPVSGERVKAVVVAAPECDRARLVEHCRARLAPHKVPRTFQFREEIPRSPLGKVLRKLLVDEETRDTP